MKKIINKISGKSPLIILLVILFTVSCSKDFLDEQPQQAVSMSQALNTIGDFDAAVYGIYDRMQSTSYYGRYIILTPDALSDDLKGNATVNRLSDYHSYLGSSTDRSNVSENIFAVCYKVIDQANRILETESDLNLDDIKGQSYAARALAHFDLVRTYGQHYTYSADASHLGVPIITNVDPLRKPARNTVAEVYEQVIADFNTALGLINDDANSYYFSKNVVKALLSRVYLYKEDWANAASMASDVINSGDYSLASAANYADIFTGEHNSEMIFEINFHSLDNPGEATALSGIYQASGQNEYLPTYDLYDLMPDGDVRKSLIIEDLGIGGGDFGTIRVNKYPDPLGYGNNPVIRLSELYLTRAEANYHLGNASAAQADVNIIRKRGLATAADVTATGTALLEEILLERRIELCFEGHRFWDLTRNKKGVFRNDCTADACSIPYPDNRFVIAIGKFETDVNENMVQNPGY